LNDRVLALAYAAAALPLLASVAGYSIARTAGSWRAATAVSRPSAGAVHPDRSGRARRGGDL